MVLAPGDRARRADPLRVRVAQRYVALVSHNAIGGNAETGKLRTGGLALMAQLPKATAAEAADAASLSVGQGGSGELTPTSRDKG